MEVNLVFKFMIMAVISVEVPDYVKKSLWNKKNVSFSTLYNQMEKENWIDVELDKPIEMSDFYALLNKEL